jgi:hypothetical protein
VYANFGGSMDIAGVFDWFALESVRMAEQTSDPRQREKLLKLALLWAAAARQEVEGTEPILAPID